MSREHNDMDVRNGHDGSAARVGAGGVQGPWNHGGAPDGSARRRRSGRLPQESLVCNLGLVLDISIGGMRVLARSSHRGAVHIKFRDYPVVEPIEATVTWSRRTGLFTREIGLRFENVSPATCGLLTRIASMHRYRRAI